MNAVLSTACCSKTFHDYVVQCQDVLIINALNVVADDVFIPVVTDTMGNKIVLDEITIVDNGIVEIPIDETLAALLNPYQNGIDIELFASTNDVQCNTPFKIQLAKMYDRARVEIIAGTLEKNVIGCEFICPPETTPE